MHRFYVPDIEIQNALPEEEAQHCLRVLRLQEGDRIEAVDGKGHLFRCRITLADRKRCELQIEERIDVRPHWGCRITVAIAPTKNADRLEWMAEKATELGVDRIIPLLCRYSERRTLKTDRLRKILVAAMKQSLKATLPLFDELTPVEEVLKTDHDGQKFIAYCDPELPRKNFVTEYKKRGDAIILIGPEGDFSKDEIKAAIGAGFVPVSLGESRLRTETAGLYAVAAIHTINQTKE